MRFYRQLKSKKLSLGGAMSVMGQKVLNAEIVLEAEKMLWSFALYREPRSLTSGISARG
jgi:hypothetical protein